MNPQHINLIQIVVNQDVRIMAQNEIGGRDGQKQTKVAQPDNSSLHGLPRKKGGQGITDGIDILHSEIKMHRQTQDGCGHFLSNR